MLYLHDLSSFMYKQLDWFMLIQILNTLIIVE